MLPWILDTWCSWRVGCVSDGISVSICGCLRWLRISCWLVPLTLYMRPHGAKMFITSFFFLGEGSAPQKTHIEPAKKVCTNLPMFGVPFQIWVFLGVCMSQAIDLWEKSIGGWHLQHGVVGTVCWATFCMPWVAIHSGVQLKLKGIPVPHHFFKLINYISQLLDSFFPFSGISPNGQHRYFVI